MVMVMDGRDGGDGSAKKMKMAEDGDTYNEVVENRFVGGHSTFNIHFSC